MPAITVPRGNRRWPALDDLPAIARHAAVVALFLLLLLPRSREAVAAKIGYESHLVSFLIGPALYSFGDGLVPGLDYFSQYGVGLGYVFSFFLGSTAKATLMNYVAFIVGAMTLFYGGSFYFLRWLFQSASWALAATLTIMFLQFHMDETFADPSSYVLRYPLLLVVCGLAGRFIARPCTMRVRLLLGGSLGASLFLNTETGTYMVVAVGTATLLLQPEIRRAVRELAQVGGTTLALLLGLSALAFGPRTLGWQYLWRMAEPLVIYGSGFNAWPIVWAPGWHYLYNVVAPGAAVATVAWGTHVARGADQRGDRGRIAALVVLSLLALFMSAKYVNQSIVAVWHVNAFGFVAVMGWWARTVRDWLRARRQSGSAGAWLARAFSAGVALLACACLLFADDPRNPSQYALRAYWRYPSLLNVLFGVRGPNCPNLGCLAPIVSTDIALITTRTQDDERVALVDNHDWVYLIEARRAPKFTFVPSSFTFTQQQLADSMAGIDLLFLPLSSLNDFWIEAAQLRNALTPTLREHFVFDGRGEDLVAWRRRR